ncbi:MAG: hypothetical protein ACLQUY_05595 [Ktedonobacterales bacterium]
MQLPNSIPLDERGVRRIADMVEPLPFSALYDGWSIAQGDAKEVGAALGGTATSLTFTARHRPMR